MQNEYGLFMTSLGLKNVFQFLSVSLKSVISKLKTIEGQHLKVKIQAPLLKRWSQMKFTVRSNILFKFAILNIFAIEIIHKLAVLSIFRRGWGRIIISHLWKKVKNGKVSSYSHETF